MKSRIIYNLFAGLFITSCSVQYLPTKTVYENIEKPDEEITIYYSLPTVKVASETKQRQTKGGVTVSVEIVEFSIEKVLTSSDYRIVPSDNPEFDVHEVKQTPSYIPKPDKVQFKVRVKNNQERILKLSDVAIVFQVDGKQISMPRERFEKWFTGMIIPGNEKNFYINGPDLTTLPKSCVIGLFLFDMPIAYSKAGNVTRKENYKWYFHYKQESKSKEYVITYQYLREPVYKESCHHCNAVGYYTKTMTCYSCGGDGVVTTNKGSYKCYGCGGTGKVQNKIDCKYCVGGQIAHPKSSKPMILEQWKGWKVQVITIPASAKVYAVNPQTKDYEYVGSGNVIVRYYYSTDSPNPIEIDYQGRTVKVLPYKPNGAKSPKITVDFSGGTLAIKGGRK